MNILNNTFCFPHILGGFRRFRSTSYLRRLRFEIFVNIPPSYLSFPPPTGPLSSPHPSRLLFLSFFSLPPPVCFSVSFLLPPPLLLLRPCHNIRQIQSSPPQQRRPRCHPRALPMASPCLAASSPATRQCTATTALAPAIFSALSILPCVFTLCLCCCCCASSWAADFWWRQITTMFDAFEYACEPPLPFGLRPAVANRVQAADIPPTIVWAGAKRTGPRVPGGPSSGSTTRPCSSADPTSLPASSICTSRPA